MSRAPIWTVGSAAVVDLNRLCKHIIEELGEMGGTILFLGNALQIEGPCRTLEVAVLGGAEHIDETGARR
ncbi:hypothetical protein YTPLAS18_03770 [Nitrospira sp.]|nr:hypothetical protein YTPLAS18_03770 [Nitrospira sp.]